MLQIYGSDGFAYDLRAALGGDVAQKRRFHYGLGKPVKAKHGKVIDWPAVTVETLKRHAKRYGMDGVAETARQNNITAEGLLELGLGGSTAERVQALSEQGFVVAEIAKRLNLGRSTVRRHLGQSA